MIIFSILEINLAVSDVNYPSIDPIPRSKPGPYVFKIEVTYVRGIHNVEILSNGYNNFIITYFYTNISLPVKEDWPQYGIGPTPQMSDGLDNGEKMIMTASVTYSMKDDECENMKCLCFYLKDDVFASFTDSDVSNNVKCFELGNKKDCKPGNMFSNKHLHGH